MGTVWLKQCHSNILTYAFILFFYKLCDNTDYIQKMKRQISNIRKQYLKIKGLLDLFEEFGFNSSTNVGVSFFLHKHFNKTVTYTLYFLFCWELTLFVWATFKSHASLISSVKMCFNEETVVYTREPQISTHGYIDYLSLYRTTRYRNDMIYWCLQAWCRLVGWGFSLLKVPWLTTTITSTSSYRFATNSYSVFSAVLSVIEYLLYKTECLFSSVVRLKYSWRT